MKNQALARYGCVFVLVAALFLTGAAPSPAAEDLSPSTIDAGAFSRGPAEDGLPADWTHQTIAKVKATEYSMVREKGRWVLKAVSRDSASGLVSRPSIDPARYPILKWSWKIENLLPESNLEKKSGDDHPARLYIGFEFDKSKFNWRERLFYWMLRLVYGKDYPARGINYVWASNEPAGTVHRSPYTRWLQTVVVESGDKQVGRWVTEERNVYADYQTVFGKDPPVISGIAVMTDPDSTHGEAAAFYGDIIFSGGTPNPPPAASGEGLPSS